MRRISLCVVCCVILVALAVTSASAYSSYATLTGKSCTYCHTQPSGGPLTTAGQYYKDHGTLPPDTPTVPSSPSGLSAVATSPTQINLSWTDASSDETGFKVERSTSASGGFTVVATLGAGVTTYSNTSLTASTTYYYRVCTYNSVGNSGYSNVASAATQAPPPTIPAAPSGLSATAMSPTQINLSWTDASSDETGFKVERSTSSTGGFTVIATLGAGVTTYSNTGLAASTTYYYRVCAYNSAGNSGYSNVASAATQAPLPTIPAAPSGLSAIAISPTQINLSWADASSDETGFKVERSTSATVGFTVLATLAAGVTTYSNTGLTASTTYYYRVCAYNSAGNSGYSNVASAATQAPPPTIPSAPSGLAATAISPTQINLSWTDASSDETGFKVERSTSASAGFTVIATLGAGVTTYSNTGLTFSTTYFYRVCAYNSAGNSGYSNVASVATQAPPPTIPAAPSGLVATAISPTQINLSWTDASSDETGFKVERSTSASSGFAVVATLGAGVTTYSNTGLTASTTYYYRVCAYNSAGNSGYSNVASAATQAPPVTIPAAPSGLSATATSATQINLSWTDASSDETGFKVERSTSATGGFTVVATLGAGVTTYSNTGLTASTTYYYRVCAYNSAGNSGYSSVASATTSAPPPTIPAAPSGLSATAIWATQINLSWTDVSSDETGFKVERSTSATGGFTVVATLGAGVTTYSNTGLTASTTYYYRVCAYNSAGNSGYSNVASAATQAPPVTVPTVPSGLSATAKSATQIDLKWTDASSDETGFKVERATTSAGPFEVIATLGAGVTTYNNAGLTASTTYYYRVCAYNTAGNSGYSNVASAATSDQQPSQPKAPTGLTASAASATQVNLKWTDASSDESGFKVERSTSASGGFELVATLGAGITTYSDIRLSASTTYYYRVCAYNTAGNSTYTNTVSVTTQATTTPKPRTPRRLIARPASSTAIRLRWQDTSTNETGFIVERSTRRTGPFVVVETVESGVTGYTDSNLNPATIYFYRICAVNAAGKSRYSDIAWAITNRVDESDDHESDQSDEQNSDD